jgi:thiosulfate dehydrogenase [quinone] large subunit
MILAFVESIKYVGHMIPIAFLRVFMGYYYLNAALASYKNGFLQRAYLAEDIRSYLPKSSAPEWFKSFLENIAIPNWQIFALSFLIVQLLIGVSYILGYLVRPFAAIAILVSVSMLWALGPHPSAIQINFIIVIHLMLGWLGAGRCLGMDYFFYKRHRGIWW